MNLAHLYKNPEIQAVYQIESETKLSDNQIFVMSADHWVKTKVLDIPQLSRFVDSAKYLPTLGVVRDTDFIASNLLSSSSYMLLVKSHNDFRIESGSLNKWADDDYVFWCDDSEIAGVVGWLPMPLNSSTAKPCALKHLKGEKPLLSVTHINTMNKFKSESVGGLECWDLWFDGIHTFPIQKGQFLNTKFYMPRLHHLVHTEEYPQGIYKSDRVLVEVEMCYAGCRYIGTYDGFLCYDLENQNVFWETSCDSSIVNVLGFYPLPLFELRD